MHPAAARQLPVADDGEQDVAARPPLVLPFAEQGDAIGKRPRLVRHPRHPWTQVRRALADEPAECLRIVDRPAPQQQPLDLDSLRQAVHGPHARGAQRTVRTARARTETATTASAAAVSTRPTLPSRFAPISSASLPSARMNGSRTRSRTAFRAWERKRIEISGASGISTSAAATTTTAA